MSRLSIDAETRLGIIDTYNRYAEGLDSKNWPLVRSCFADSVYIDYGSISEPTGAPDVPREADAWLEVLQGVINGFDITRHTITNHRFSREGERIVCRAYLTADHVILANSDDTAAGPDEIATVVGEYTNTCELGDHGWKIRKSKLEMQWSRGNGELFPEAMARAAKLRGD